MVFWFLKSFYLKSFCCSFLQNNNNPWVCAGMFMPRHGSGRDGTLVQQLALSPHSTTVLSSNLTTNGGLSAWCSHVLPLPVWVYSGCSGFLPEPKRCKLRQLGILNGRDCERLFVAMLALRNERYDGWSVNTLLVNPALLY